MNPSAAETEEPLTTRKSPAEPLAPYMSGDACHGAPVPGFDPSVPNPARMYDYYLLRHEALCYRAGVRDLRRRAVAAV
jgi:hypothetical protein